MIGCGKRYTSEIFYKELALRGPQEAIAYSEGIREGFLEEVALELQVCFS